MAINDQAYLNELYGGLDAKDQIKEPKDISKEELNAMSETAKEKHLFLHERAVQAFHEEQAKKKRGKEDKYGDMTTADIIKDDPLAVNNFRAVITRAQANGMAVYSVAWNRNSTMLSSTGHDRSLTLWRPTGTLARKLKGMKGWTVQAHFNPKDTTIVVCASDTLYIWDTVKGTLKAEWEAHSAMINSCQYSNSGRYIVSCGNDLVIKVFSVLAALKHGQEKNQKKHSDEEAEKEKESQHSEGRKSSQAVSFENKTVSPSLTNNASFLLPNI